MCNYLKKTTLLFIGLFFLSATTLLTAQDTKSIFDEMSYSQILDVTITANLEALADKRNSKKEKATLSFIDARGAKQVWDIKLTIRGKYRRMHCELLPPLKINFEKDDLREAGLTKFDDLKIVNQCIGDEAIGKELLVKEYLAYELYNNITEESFRVQFLNITYIDSNTGEKIVQPGFIIEDTAQLRDRIGANKVKQETGFTAEQFNQNQFQTISLFQYWIGNSDWSVTFGRNIKVLEKDGQLIAIPYDFDFSGMVDAPYAIPNNDFRLTSVKERVYLGFEKKATQLQTTIDFFVAMKSTFKKRVKKAKLLSRNMRKETWTYLKSYFDKPNEINFGVELERQVVPAKGISDQTQAGK